MMIKKNLLLISMGVVIAMGTMGCGANEETLSNRSKELQAEIQELEIQKETLENQIVDIKEDKGIAKYVVTFEIKQSHFSLDITKHIKDAMNAIEIEIPVDKEYYDNVDVGDTINDDFRVGSLVMKGSFGSWDVTVKGKDIR